MLLETTWGIKAIIHVESLSTQDLQLCYIKAMRVINLPKIDIDTSTKSGTIHLKRLEPSTIIKLHEVELSVSTSSDGSSREFCVVGKDITLTDKNCSVINSTVLEYKKHITCCIFKFNNFIMITMQYHT